MKKHMRVLSVFFLIIGITLIPSVLDAAAKVTVRDIRHRSSQGHTRIVIDLSGSTQYEYKRLKSPDRVYLDFESSSLDGSIDKELAFGEGILKRVRTAQYKQDVVRIVLDLGDVDKYEIFELTKPYRVVIDMFGKRPRFNTKRVVIDAGHGGKDPGALGPGGIKEKDLVLDIAKRVKTQLEKEKGYEVIMTRSGDKYLDLERRTVLANNSKADLFVSIHVNAHRSRSVRGFETYLLNWTDDAEAMRVAARENKISFKRMKQSRSEVGLILASLQLQNKRDESLKLAHYVQDSMVSSLEGRYKSVIDLGVKQALFYVLVGAEMPSVLVEASFITNHSEARRLSSPQYRQYVASGISSGIKTYLDNLKPVQQIARR